MTDKQPESLLLTSSELESTVFSDLDEFLAVTDNLDFPTFIIPPGTNFSKPEKILLLTDFSQSPGISLKNMFKWGNPFVPLVSACEVTKKS